MQEMFLLYVFGLLRLTLLVIIVRLIGAQLISWFPSEAAQHQQGPLETILNMQIEHRKEKSSAYVQQSGVVGAWS